LLDEVAELARADHVGSLTLTTFRDVPWNGPYYRRCGFRFLEDEELKPGLKAVFEAEARRGLVDRVCMKRDL
jgi:hypothetical protein